MNNLEAKESTQLKPDLLVHFHFHWKYHWSQFRPRKLHWHNELKYAVKQGTGSAINGHEYFEPGDVFIINNDEIHLAFDDKDLVAGHLSVRH